MWVVSVRRFRHEALGVAIALGAVGVLAWVTGASINSEYHGSGLANCLARSDRADCQQLINRFGDRFASLQLLIVPLVVLPGLLGAFVGAPLVARELESGSHRFLWTQGVTKRRWFAVTSSVALSLMVLAGSVYSVVAAFWLDVTNRVSDQRFDRLYDFQGVVPVAASVLAAGVGILCGVVFGRTLLAMAATIGIFVAVRVATAVLVRPRLARPLTLSFPFSQDDPLAGTGAWQLSNRTVDASGLVLGRNGSLDISGLAGRCPGIATEPGQALPAPEAVDACLRDLDVRSVVRYHPGDRFWTFQIIESSLLVALAGACLLIASWALRRRAG